MTAAFGTPAPLPGQPGFRSSPSESMARETSEMEQRLARLKEDLSAEAEARESVERRVGGARWRSARADIGSVRAYAKDVKLRHEHQIRQRPQHAIFSNRGGISSGNIGDDGGGVGQGIRPQAGAGARAAVALRERDEQQRCRRQQKGRNRRSEEHRGGVPQPPTKYAEKRSPSSSEEENSGFTVKEVHHWSVKDTLEWLDSLGLCQHRVIFKLNEISGPILLEVGPDDLDYLHVKVLAHRKRILKGIEELRQGAAGSKDSADVPPPVPVAPKLGDTNGGGSRHGRQRLHDEVGRAASSNSQRGSSDRIVERRHWSQLNPLSDNQIEKCEETIGPSNNLAEGEYNEELAHSSFSEAVATWRSQQKRYTRQPPSSPDRDESAATRAPMAGNLKAEEKIVRGKWLTLTPPGKGERQPRNITMLGVKNSAGGAANCWVNPFATPRSPERNVNGSNGTSQGDYQEEGEEPEASSTPRRPRARPTATTTEKRPVMATAIRNEYPAIGEEAEHAAFRQAVADWNRGSRIDGAQTETESQSRKNGRSTVNNGATQIQRDDMMMHGKPTRRAAEVLADTLREQIDADHRAQAKKLEAIKRGLLRGLGEDGDGGREKQRGNPEIVSPSGSTTATTAAADGKGGAASAENNEDEGGGLWEEKAESFRRHGQGIDSEDNRTLWAGEEKREGHCANWGEKSNDSVADVSSVSSSGISDNNDVPSARHMEERREDLGSWGLAQENVSTIEIECVASVLGDHPSCESSESRGYVVEEDYSGTENDRV